MQLYHVVGWRKGRSIYSTSTLTNEERIQLVIHYEKIDN